METFLIDTNILIEVVRGNSKVANYLEKIRDTAYISFVTAVELIQGVRNKKELQLIENFLANWQVDWGSKEIHQKSLEILKQINLKNELGLLDSLVAATAIENNSTLVTFNEKHFKDIKSLKVKTEI